MKIRTRSLSQYVSIFCVSALLGFVVKSVHADYVVDYPPDPFPECAHSCAHECVKYVPICHHKIKTYHPKKHCHRQYRCHSCAAIPACRPCCAPSRWDRQEIVEFRMGPPCCGGRYVYEDYYYAPDLATGDDDPIIDPNMNIDK